MAYVRLDKIKPTAHIESFVFTDGDLKNGQFISVGEKLPEFGGEVVKVAKATTAEEAEAIVTTVHGVYASNQLDFDIMSEVTKAGEVGRAHVIEKGDVISFAVEADKVSQFKPGEDVTIGEDGFGIKPAGEGDAIGDAIGTVQAIEFLNNIGDLVVVRFK